MARSIAANIIFRTGKAIAGIGKFKRELVVASRDVAGLSKEADKAGVTTGQMLRVMENRRAPTQFQRNVKLTNETVRTFTGLLKEGRLILGKTQLQGKKGLKLRGARRVTRDLERLRDAAEETTNQFSVLFGALALAIGGLGAGAVFDDIQGFFQDAIGLAAKDEANLVTFNTMLGSAEQSAKLMESITEFSARTPFQRSDIIEGSRTLLRVTRDNIVENEKLFKLSANIAALKPGTKVAQTALGIAQATVGEFEILKSFGLVLRAEQFKGVGVKGGAAYVEAVTGEIERQFTDLTGGRNLVEALSQSLTGKASTLKDNAEIAGLTLGKAFVEGFALKGILNIGISAFADFNKALRVFTTGRGDTAGIDPTMVALADFVNDMIINGKRFIEVSKKLLGPVVQGFRNLDASTQKLFFRFALGGGLVSAALGVITPIVVGIISLGSILFGVLSPLGGAILPALGVLLTTIPIIALWVGGIVLGFGFIRNKGETVFQTLVRLKDAVIDLAVGAFARFKAFVEPIVRKVLPVLIDSIRVLASNFGLVKAPIREFISFFAGDTTLTIEKFAMLGLRVANVMIVGIVFATNKTIRALIILNKAFRAISPVLKPVVSDILNIGRALFDLISGADTAKASLRTIFFGIADVISSPLRELLRFVLGSVEDTVRGLAVTIRPFNESLARQINTSAESLFKTREKLREGLLETTAGIRSAEIKVKMDADLVAEATLIQGINIDGEQVADSLTKVEMRARNSGRGGDPVSPEELGFVLEGGTRIRPVSITEVARDF